MTVQDDSGTYASLAGQEDTSGSQKFLRGSKLGRYVIIEPIGSGGGQQFSPKKKKPGKP